MTKIFYTGILLAALGVFVGCSGLNYVGIPPVLKVTVRAVDFETGKPIDEANAELTYSQISLTKRRRGLPRTVHLKDAERTEEDGLASFSAMTWPDAWVAVKKEEYYRSAVVFDFRFGKSKRKTPPHQKVMKVNKLTNFWTPVNPTFEVKLRPKKNPAPMICNDIVGLNCYCTSERVVEYDFLAQDAVAPYGKGKVADMTYRVKEYLRTKEKVVFKWTIDFANEGDGFIPWDTNGKYYMSDLKYPYEAPESGYQRHLEFYEILTLNGRELKKKEMNYNYVDHYIFHITRCKAGKFHDINDAITDYYGYCKLPYLRRSNYRDGFFIRAVLYNANPFNRSLEYNRMNLDTQYGLRDAIIMAIAENPDNIKTVKNSYANEANKLPKSRQTNKVYREYLKSYDFLRRVYNKLTIEQVPDQYKEMFKERNKLRRH